MAEAVRRDAPQSTELPADDRRRLPYSLLLELTVHDPDTIAELVSYPEGEPRDRFALDALRIGVLSLKQARGQIDADLVRRESDRLLVELASRLDEHARTVHDRVTGTLKDYFDPHSGRFQERVNRLIQKDGELESILRSQIGADDSQLARTLGAHFGSDSPLLRWLNPDQSQGLMAALRETLDQQLQVQREHVLSQFSLDNKEGALARFIGELTDTQGKLSEQLHGKIDEAVRQFSLDDENSALSGLVRRVTEAQRTITSEFSLDEEGSALARLKRELLKLLEEQRESNQKFQEEIKGALQAMVVRRQEAARSTRHGLEFEDAVFEHLQREAQRLGDVASSVGSSTGLIRHCKVGDCVLELGPESAAPAARVVIEAKEDAGYQLADARTEIEEARKNRDAQVGLFIFSKSTAPAGLEPLLRFGNDVIIVWDAEDAETDLYFRAGLSLARALCVRHRAVDESQKLDFQELERAILEIEKRSGSLEEIATWAGTIKNNSDRILDRVSKTRAAFEKQIEVLREKTELLKQALDVAESESL